MSPGDSEGHDRQAPATVARAWPSGARRAHPTRPLRRLAVAVAALASLLGCARPAPVEPGQLYARPRAERGAGRAPLIVIPPLPAVTLVEGESDRIVWDATAGSSGTAGDGMSLPPLPMRQGIALRDLRDGLRPAGGALTPATGRREAARAAGALRDLLDALRLGGYRMERTGAEEDGTTEPPDAFVFDYDWRRDLVEAAAQLHRFLLDRRAELQATRAGEPAGRAAPPRFDVVAHSSGGLLLRYYLRYGSADLPADGSLPPLTGAGADLVGRAVLIGTPNGGAIEALLDLVGERGRATDLRGLSPLVLATYPSIYEMLPRGRHGSVVRLLGETRQVSDDLFDAALWENLGWGLASADPDRPLALLLPREPDPVARRRVALDHLRKCLRRARRFCEALDVPGRPPPGLTLHLLAADAALTDAVAGVDWQTGRVRVIERRPGDGIVLRSSALLDERVGGRWSPALLSPIDWSSVMLFHVDGAALGRDPGFIDNLLFLLLEQPRRSSER